MALSILVNETSFAWTTDKWIDGSAPETGYIRGDLSTLVPSGMGMCYCLLTHTEIKEISYHLEVKELSKYFHLESWKLI